MRLTCGDCHGIQPCKCNVYRCYACYNGKPDLCYGRGCPGPSTHLPRPPKHTPPGV